MIQADRAHLESKLRQLALAIREKELSLFAQNFRVLGTQSSFLVGVGFSELYMKLDYINKIGVSKGYGFRDFDSTPELFFTAFVVCSIGLNVLVMAISSWCLIFGTELAIRGDSFEDMKKTVDGLYIERKWTIRYFLCGIGCTMISGIGLGWVKMHYTSRISICTVFAISLITVFCYITYRVRPRFRFPKELRGKHRPNDFVLRGGFDPERGRTIIRPIAMTSPHSSLM